MSAICRVLSAVRSSPESVAPSARHALLALAVLLASAAVAACGGSVESKCPPPPGSELGSPAAQGCGCFAQASVSATPAELGAAIDAKLRASPPGDCTYVPASPTGSLRSGVRVEVDALTSMRSTDPREGPDGQPLRLRRYFFALEP